MIIYKELLHHFSYHLPQHKVQSSKIECVNNSFVRIISIIEIENPNYHLLNIEIKIYTEQHTLH